MELLLFVAGVVVGLVLAIPLATARAYRLAASRRAVAGAAAGFARIGLETLPTRTAADIIAGRVRVVLGGLPYDLRVLTRRENREWLEGLDTRFASLGNALEAAADDKPQILQLLAGHTSWMLEMLRSYDKEGILPDPAFVDDFATDSEILVATVEVWRAANPLAAMLVEGVAGTTDSTSFEPESWSPAPTAGEPTT